MADNFSVGHIVKVSIMDLALSTLIIKVASAIYLFKALKTKTHVYSWPQFDLQRWKACLIQTLPSGFNFLIIIIGAFILIAFIGQFGSEAIAGYSVALRIEQILLLPVLGLSSAVMALVGQNFDIPAFDRIQDTFSQTLKFGF